MPFETNAFPIEMHGIPAFLPESWACCLTKDFCYVSDAGGSEVPHSLAEGPAAAPESVGFLLHFVDFQILERN